MQYALVNGVRSQPQKGIEGVCESCNSRLISKCGDFIVHHWAHYNSKYCDKWWESETIWHRNWKNQFPEEFREVNFKDVSSGEVHRADIHTSFGITVEFQHSLINSDERVAREGFYNNLIWVIDGTRRKNDYKRFRKKSHYLTSYKHKPNIFQVSNIEEVFPSEWSNSSAYVIFDFMPIADSVEFFDTGVLYCLFPQKVGGAGIVAKMSANSFVRSVIEGEWIGKSSKFLEELKKDDILFRTKEEEVRHKLKLYDMNTQRIPNKRHWRF